MIAQGGCREQTLPTKSNPNPDLSDPQPHQQQNSGGGNKPQNHHLEAMAKTRLAFNETLWTLPPPMHTLNNSNNNNDVEEDDCEEEDEDMEDDEEINVT